VRRPMMRLLLSVICSVLLSMLALGKETQQGKSLIEVSKPMPGGQGLGTKAYGPTAREIPFLRRVEEKPIDYWAGTPMPPPMGQKEDPADKAAKQKRAKEESRKAKEYSLAGQVGKYVGWFGIVRGISWNKEKGQTRLLLEHKYFDGLTDLHLHIVSIYGAGDFAAVLSGKADTIPMLSLIRVYGRVSEGTGGVPVVSAEYARLWDWGLFTFMDYGPDKTNPKWVKLRKVKGDDVYSPRPTKEFYEATLGKR